MLAKHRLERIDFAPRAAMPEQAAAVVVEMVRELHELRLDRMKAPSDRLRVIEMEADRLIPNCIATSAQAPSTRARCSCPRSHSRPRERPSTAAAQPAWWPTGSC
jgi:hypothetical protein